MVVALPDKATFPNEVENVPSSFDATNLPQHIGLLDHWPVLYRKRLLKNCVHKGER